MVMKSLLLLLFLTFTGGHPLTDENNRINGGTPITDPDDYKFHVSIRSGAFHICSGIIIGQRWVLTAANCVNGQSERLLSVWYGSHDRTLKGKLVGVSRVYVNQNFDRGALQGDLALVRTEENFEENFYSVAKLAEPDDLLMDGGRLEMAGWGVQGTSSGQLSNDLRMVISSAVSIDDCASGYRDVIPINTDWITQLCVGNLDNGVESFCYGDVGGAAYRRGSSPEKSRVWGIASFSTDCGNDRTRPSVFTRVSEYRVWISQITGISECE